MKVDEAKYTVPVQTYTLDHVARKTLSRRFAFRALIDASLWIVLALFLLFPWLRKVSLSAAFIFVAVGAVGGCVGQFLLLRENTKRYAVLVDDEAICMLTKEGGKSVRRGKIRTIRDSARGLYLSEDIGWRARLGGSVWVPRELHEYEQLKDLAASWRKI